MEAIEKKELGGGVFIIDNNHKKSIFTPEDFSEEQQMMKAAVRDFIDREVWPNKERFEKKESRYRGSKTNANFQLNQISISKGKRPKKNALIISVLPNVLVTFSRIK